MAPFPNTAVTNLEEYFSPLFLDEVNFTYFLPSFGNCLPLALCIVVAQAQQQSSLDLRSACQAGLFAIQCATLFAATRTHFFRSIFCVAEVSGGFHGSLANFLQIR